MKKIIKKEIIIKKTKRHGFTCWLTYNLYIDIKANTDKNELLTVQMFHEAAVSYHILITLLWWQSLFTFICNIILILVDPLSVQFSRNDETIENK